MNPLVLRGPCSLGLLRPVQICGCGSAHPASQCSLPSLACGLEPHALQVDGPTLACRMYLAATLAVVAVIAITRATLSAGLQFRISTTTVLGLPWLRSATVLVEIRLDPMATNQSASNQRRFFDRPHPTAAGLWTTVP